MNKERLTQVLLSPYLSEKTSLLTDTRGQYAFKVLMSASKTEVKAAVESLFKVAVKSVSICRVKGKERRSGRTVGRRKDWKKAYVSLKAGETLDFAGYQA